MLLQNTCLCTCRILHCSTTRTCTYTWFACICPPFDVSVHKSCTEICICSWKLRLPCRSFPAFLASPRCSFARNSLEKSRGKPAFYPSLTPLSNVCLFAPEACCSRTTLVQRCGISASTMIPRSQMGPAPSSKFSKCSFQWPHDTCIPSSSLLVQPDKGILRQNVRLTCWQ